MRMDTIKTEGIKYAGSKLKIIPYIAGIVSELEEVKSVLDGFSGTTRVSQALGQMGFRYHFKRFVGLVRSFCNMLSESHRFRFILSGADRSLKRWHGRIWWLVLKIMGATQVNQKKPFQQKNTRKLDAIKTK